MTRNATTYDRRTIALAWFTIACASISYAMMIAQAVRIVSGG